MRPCFLLLALMPASVCWAQGSSLDYDSYAGVGARTIRIVKNATSLEVRGSLSNRNRYPVEVDIVPFAILADKTWRGDVFWTSRRGDGGVYRHPDTVTIKLEAGKGTWAQAYLHIPTGEIQDVLEGFLGICDVRPGQSAQISPPTVATQPQPTVPYKPKAGPQEVTTRLGLLKVSPGPAVLAAIQKLIFSQKEDVQQPRRFTVTWSEKSGKREKLHSLQYDIQFEEILFDGKRLFEGVSPEILVAAAVMPKDKYPTWQAAIKAELAGKQ